MRFTSALTALVLTTAGAVAADYTALRGSQMGPTTGYSPSIATPDANWEGFYIGAFGGYTHSANRSGGAINAMVAEAFRNTAIETQFQVSRWPVLSPGPTRSASYGLFAGYNMMADEVLFGLDLQGGLINHNHSTSDSITRSVTTTTGYIETASINSSINRKIDAYSTLRLRVGQSFGNFMPYIAGGLAVAKGSATSTITYRHSGIDADPTAAPVLTPFDTGWQTVSGGTRNTYALGISGAVGADFLLGNIFGRLEFSHSRFNSQNIAAEISKLNAGVGVKF